MNDITQDLHEATSQAVLKMIDVERRGVTSTGEHTEGRVTVRTTVYFDRHGNRRINTTHRLDGKRVSLRRLLHAAECEHDEERFECRLDERLRRVRENTGANP